MLSEQKGFAYHMRLRLAMMPTLKGLCSLSICGSNWAAEVGRNCFRGHGVVWWLCATIKQVSGGAQLVSGRSKKELVTQLGK